MGEALNAWYLLASLACIGVFAVHTFLGGRLVVRPLLAAEGLGKVVRLTLYYCWHMATIMTAAMALGFLFAGLTPGRDVLAIGLTALAAAFALLNLRIVVSERVNPLRMPQWGLFAIVVLCGIAGSLS